MGNANKNKTWLDFSNENKNKKIFIFGAGNQLRKYLNRVKHSNYLPKSYYGIVDNDSKKINDSIENYIGDSFNRFVCKCILSSELLLEYKKENISVLITSLRRYSEIASQLKKMDIKSIWSMSLLDDCDNSFLELDSSFGGLENDLVEKYCRYPIQNNKLLFYNTVWGSHDDAIIPELLKKCSNLDIVCVLNRDADNKIGGVRYIFEGNIEDYICELETAHIWIYGDTIPRFARKRSGQICIRTKHWSSITLKTFYLDDKWFSRNSAKAKQIIENAKIIDYSLTGSDFDRKTMVSGFGLHSKDLRVGSPRSDILFQKKHYNHIRKCFGIKDKRIVLYAPTFRRIVNEYGQVEFEKEPYLKREPIIQALEAKASEQWIFFYRAHPSVALFAKNQFCDDSMVDVSSYWNVEELIAASDLVITDYSSLMFEPAYIGTPTILYAPDKDKYIGKERDLLIDYDELPFPCAVSEEELIKVIGDFDITIYKENVRKFFEKYDIHEDGHASERAADAIIELMQI